MIRDKSVIKLANKEYTVVSTIIIKREKYAFIINIENYNDVLFVKNIKDEVEVIKEKSKLKELINLFNIKINNKKLIEN